MRRKSVLLGVLGLIVAGAILLAVYRPALPFWHKRAVIGVGGTDSVTALYSDPELRRPKLPQGASELDLLFGRGGMETGTVLTVLTERRDAVEVKTPAGDQGWVYRCAVCSSQELERRTKRHLVPTRLKIANAAGDNLSGMVTRFSIENNVGRAEPSPAVYMDYSLQGKKMKIGSTEVVGDPRVIYLPVAEGRVERLPIW